MMTRKIFQELQQSSVKVRGSTKIKKGENMITRKIFQELQQSSVKVKGSTKIKKGENVNKEAIDTNENIKSKKLSSVPAKHSKPKNVGKENRPKKLPKAVTKKEAVSKAKACTQKEDLQATVTFNQSRHKTYLYSCASTSDISNDSAVQDLEKPSQAYWQEIAEQRRIAHEKTVLENEMLADEINVLETENMQLKSELEAAEVLLKHMEEKEAFYKSFNEQISEIEDYELCIEKCC